MHAYDRTMLAKLGFADADKRDPQHDLACQYLALPEVIGRIGKLLGLEKVPAAYLVQYDGAEESGTECTRIGRCGVTFEHQIVKGSGQYRTTIGFADLVYRIELLTDRSGRILRRRLDASDRWGRVETLPGCQGRDLVNVGVEVKIAPVGIGDVLRQIKLYRAYTDHWTAYGGGLSGDITRWVVATAYPLSALDMQSLTNERIVHVLLGRGFQAFLESQAEASGEGNVEV